jgi:hypothetical protein
MDGRKSESEIVERETQMSRVPYIHIVPSSNPQVAVVIFNETTIVNWFILVLSFASVFTFPIGTECDKRVLSSLLLWVEFGCFIRQTERVVQYTIYVLELRNTV